MVEPDVGQCFKTYYISAHFFGKIHKKLAYDDYKMSSNIKYRILISIIKKIFTDN